MSDVQEYREAIDKYKKNTQMSLKILMDTGIAKE